MPKNKMSYRTANKIIDLYSELLINLNKLKKYEKYAYSELKCFDLIDISNALKLTAAYRVFNTFELNDTKIEELKKYSREDYFSLMQFFNHFYPDNVASELRKLDSFDEMAILDSIKLTTHTQTDIEELFNKEEIPASFLDYCIQIGRSDSNYWGKIYDRIGISWEADDDKDPIYVLIKLGVNYQSKESLQNQGTKTNNEIIPEKRSKNIFKLLIERFFK